MRKQKMRKTNDSFFYILFLSQLSFCIAIPISTMVLTVNFWSRYCPLCYLWLRWWWSICTCLAHWSTFNCLYSAICLLLWTYLALAYHLIPCCLKTLVTFLSLSDPFQEVRLWLFTFITCICSFLVLLLLLIYWA